MAKVALAAAAGEDLDRLIVTRTLPADAHERVRRSLCGASAITTARPEWVVAGLVCGSFSGRRWMPIVYQFEKPGDCVAVVIIQDARSSRAAMAER